MKTFKQFFSESFHGYVKGSRGPFEVYVNPNIADLADCVTGQGKSNSPRGLLDVTNDNFYIWNAADALHVEIYKNQDIISNPRQIITLDLYLTPNHMIESMEVSASMRGVSAWDKMPQTKSRILRSKHINHLIAPTTLKDPNLVTYYDGMNWEKKSKV